MTDKAGDVASDKDMVDHEVLLIGEQGADNRQPS